MTANQLPNIKEIKMEKAYDIKALGEIIVAEAKKHGLTLAEETVEALGSAVYVGTKKWAKESAVLSETKIDDFAAAFYDQVDPLVLPYIVKIDIDGDGK